jgi:RNA polymerase sigma-70 factor (ECF subfamily)
MAAVAFGSPGLLADFVHATAVSPWQRGAGRPRLVTSMTQVRSDTASLLARCAKSDAAAFRELYDANSGRLYGIALRITRQPALASDAVHDAFLQVWRNSARFDPERGNADGWLISLVRYRALDIARRQSRETPGLDIPEQTDTDPDALSRLVTGSESKALRHCLEQVEAPRRALVMLAFIEGLTQNEVAARVGQPLGTVKSSIRRALLSMRSCLQTMLGGTSAERQS